MSRLEAELLASLVVAILQRWARGSVANDDRVSQNRTLAGMQNP